MTRLLAVVRAVVAAAARPVHTLIDRAIPAEHQPRRK